MSRCWPTGRSCCRRAASCGCSGARAATGNRAIHVPRGARAVRQAAGEAQMRPAAPCCRRPHPRQPAGRPGPSSGAQEGIAPNPRTRADRPVRCGSGRRSHRPGLAPDRRECAHSSGRGPITQREKQQGQSQLAVPDSDRRASHDRGWRPHIGCRVPDLAGTVRQLRDAGSRGVRADQRAYGSLACRAGALARAQDVSYPSGHAR